MYKLEILPIAKKDMDDIIYYIHNSLKNYTVSKKMKDLFLKSLDYISEFPYGNSVYEVLGTLKNEYRRHKIKNFLIFYVINEDEKIITIVRVLYQKMNITNILK